MWGHPISTIPWFINFKFTATKKISTKTSFIAENHDETGLAVIYFINVWLLVSKIQNQIGVMIPFVYFQHKLFGFGLDLTRLDVCFREMRTVTANNKTPFGVCYN